MIARSINAEVEQCVLMGMLTPHLFTSDLINPSIFGVPEHRRLLEVIQKLEEPNYVMVRMHLKEHDPDIHDWFCGLLDKEPAGKTDWEYYLRTTIQNAAKREVLSLEQSLQGDLEKAETSEEQVFIADKFKVDVDEISSRLMAGQNQRSVRDLAVKAIDDLQKRMSGEIESTAIPTGIPALDKMMGGGFEEARLTVVGARPGTGKTALGMQFIHHAAFKQRKNVLFFSLEMTEDQIMKRWMCVASGIPVSHINQGRHSDGSALTEGELRRLMGLSAEIAKCGHHLKMETNSKITSGQIAAVCKTSQVRPDLVLVDYVQIVRPDVRRDSRLNEVTDISNTFVSLKKELNIPVVVLAQLNRNPANSDRPPRPTDLRESGALEQDADQIMLLNWTDENPHDDEIFCDIILAKNRDGGTGVVPCMFNKPHLKFDQRFDD